MICSFNAHSQDEFYVTSNGTKYKLLKTQSGKKIGLDKVVTFNFIEKTESDSVLFSSYNLPMPFQVQTHPSKTITDLMEVFVLLYEHDSVLIHVPTDSIFKNRKAKRPPYLPKGSALAFLIKIENVQSPEEIQEEEKKGRQTEDKLLSRYLARNKLNPQIMPSGLLYIPTKTTNNVGPQFGDTVFINYSASTIKGKIFDSSIESIAKKAKFERKGTFGPVRYIVGEGGTITAIDEGFLQMSEGASARFIISSQLAFGGLGFGKIIKPFTTLVLDIDLIKIRKAISRKHASLYSNRQQSKLALSILTENKPSPAVNSLTSFLYLFNEETKKRSMIINTPVIPDKQWYLRWFEFINKILLN